MTDSSHAPYTSYRDDPRWQAARADYLSDEGSRDDTLRRRLQAVDRMSEIERQWEVQSG